MGIEFLLTAAAIARLVFWVLAIILVLAVGITQVLDSVRRAQGKRPLLARRPKPDICVCGDGNAADVTHRTDGPCYVTERDKRHIDSDQPPR